MAYQPSWVIQCKVHPCRRAVVVLFNPLLRDKGVHAFPKSISLKVNVIARLEFELVNFEVAVWHIKP